MHVSSYFLAFTLLFPTLLHAITVEVTDPNPKFGTPVISGNTATMDSSFGAVGFSPLGNPYPQISYQSIGFAVSPAGEWEIKAEGGDWGLNTSTLYSPDQLTTLPHDSGPWEHSLIVDVDSRLVVTIFLGILQQKTNGQQNSIGVSSLSLTYLPTPVGFANYVDWRKNDGTQAGYDIWRQSYSNGIEPTCEPRYLWVMFMAALFNRTRRT